MTSDNLVSIMPVALSASVMNLHFNGVGAIPSDNTLAEQVIGEIALWSDKSTLFSLAGEMQHSKGSNRWELGPEFDWVLPKSEMLTGAVGALAYLDRLDLDGVSAPLKGRSFGVLA